MSTDKNSQGRIPQIYGSATDVGCVRGHNEDSFCAQSPLFVVADGMGGHEAGEVASEIAIQTMLANPPQTADAELLAAQVKAANRAVLRGAADGTGKPGMGTTMTAAVIVDDKLLVAQVGDSRAYLLHEGELQRITRDHSLVADLIEQGSITEEEARVHPQRSVITRALGSDPAMEPDIYTLRLVEGDRLMLCSDGLSSMIEDSAIRTIMRGNADPQDCCDALVEEALAAGGMDNVTVVVVNPFDTEGSSGTVHTGKSRNIGKAPIIWTLAVVLVLVGAGFGFNYYAQNSYYLIAEDGNVSIYRGLPGDFAGLHFSWLENATDIEVSKLAPTAAERLGKGIAVDSLEEANQLVESYRESISPSTTDNAKTEAGSATTSDKSATDKTAQ